jgi:outer membrane immunogenic protein
MYRISIALAAFVSTLAFNQIASAADLPVKAAPAPAAALPYSWTSFYVGANLGYGWGRGDTDVEPLPSAATFVNLAPNPRATDAKGILGGVQVGYNYQMGIIVLGAEADFQGADIKGSFFESPIIQNNGTPFPGAGFINISQKLDWFGTVRGRLGITPIDPKLLFYVTGGLAYGHVEGAATVDFRPVGTEQYPGSVDTTKMGWTLGGGIEWAFLDHWSVKAEYLRVDLGKAGVTVAAIPALPPFAVNWVFHTQVDIARAGVNYKF